MDYGSITFSPKLADRNEALIRSEAEEFDGIVQCFVNCSVFLAWHPTGLDRRPDVGRQRLCRQPVPGALRARGRRYSWSVVASNGGPTLALL